MSFVLGLVVGVGIFFIIAGITSLITYKKVKDAEVKPIQNISSEISNEATKENL